MVRAIVTRACRDSWIKFILASSRLTEDQSLLCFSIGAATAELSYLLVNGPTTECVAGIPSLKQAVTG